MNELPAMSAMSYTSSTPDMNSLLSRDFINAIAANQGFPNNIPFNQVVPPKKEPAVTARIIKVFIADANENLPLDKRVVYSGDEKLTDLTDQELFFEVPIAELLAKHNEVRKATVDKKQSEKFGRDIFLEPARIRDLKMVVVTVASF